MRSLRIVSGAAVTAAAFLLCACGSSGGGNSSSATSVNQDKGVTLVYATPGPGAFQDAEVNAWVKPFEAKTGVKFILTEEDTAKLTAMVKAGNVSWSVTDSTPFFDSQNCGTIVEKINLTGVSGSFTPGSHSSCGSPQIYTSMMLMYNSKTYKSNPPTTWADFFNPKKYPGIRVMPDESYGGYFEIALTAAGVPKDKLYPLNTNLALKEFDKIKGSSKVTPTGSLEQQLMLNNQADLAIVPSTRAYSVLKAGGTYWKIAPAPTPGFLGVNEFAIPKGAPHADIAQQFVRFAAEPAQQTKMAELVGGTEPTNKAAKKPALTGLAATVSPAAYPSITVNTQYWSQNYSRLTALFENWSTS
jgi:putative spermidine/putrescine transport system substrate-binding protein